MKFDFIQWATTHPEGGLLAIIVVIGLVLFVGAALRFFRSF